MTKIILSLAIAAGAVTLAPAPVAAAPCTDAYVKCLNDSYDYTGALQAMADVECLGKYTACVGAMLKFW